MTKTQTMINWERLSLIHKKTSGRCHLCGTDHALENYGLTWEKEHSRARALGGTDNLNNLFVACIPCNRSKGVQSSRSFRRAFGLRRAPLSKKECLEKRLTQAVVGAAIVGVGALLFDRKNFWWGIGIGGTVGFLIEPEWNNQV